MEAYSTHIEANAYFVNRLYTQPWDETLSATKTVALTEATSRMDRLRYSGTKVDPDQELEFPRYYGDEPDGSEEVPVEIQYACNEIAMSLIDGADPDQDFENLGVSSQGYSNVRQSYVRSDVLEHTAAGIPSVTAWQFILPYLAETKPIHLNRVS